MNRHASPLSRIFLTIALVFPVWIFSAVTGHATYIPANDTRLVYMGAWRAEGSSFYTLYPGSHVRIRLQGSATLDIRNYPDHPSKLKIRPLGTDGGTVRTINQSVVLNAPNVPVEFEVNYMSYLSGRAFAGGQPRFQLYGLTLGDESELFPATEPEGPWSLEFTGDSITHAMRVLGGSGDELATMDGTLSYGYFLSRMKDAPYRIRGFSGESLRTFWQKIGYFQGGVLLQPPQPDFLFLNIGSNNRHWSERDFFRRFEEAVQQARLHMPDSHIIALNFFLNGRTRNRAIQYALNRQAAGHGHLFDVHGAVRLQYTDGSHPNAATHRNVAEAIRNHMRHTPVAADYDGDGYADPATFWGPTGNWRYWSSETDQVVIKNWGFTGNHVMTADFDGDGKADLVAYDPRRSRFHIWRSQEGRRIESFGLRRQSLPIIGDYDGDGIPDLTVYAPNYGAFGYRPSSGGSVVIQQFGTALDIPVLGDFDGDGIHDLALFNRGSAVWTILRSSDGQLERVQWGNSAMVPVPGDYDGDGITDIAAYHPGTGNWHIRMSGGGSTVVQWGYRPAVPVVADYDGDGKDDVAVYDPDTGRWLILESESGLGRTFIW